MLPKPGSSFQGRASVVTAEAAVLVWVSEYKELKHVFEGLCWAKAALGLYPQCRGSQRGRKGCVFYGRHSPQAQERRRASYGSG